MSCPKTQHILMEYFTDRLPPVTRDEIERHLSVCQTCNAELESLLLASNRLEKWQDERVPHWNRGRELFHQHEKDSSSSNRNRFWQWFPTAASLAMVLLMVFNTTIVSSNEGVTISFGGQGESPGIAGLEARFDQFSRELQASQDQVLSARLADMDDRQDRNNLRLMQAVLDQTQQTTAENFEQMYSYFEQQRQQDLTNVQVSYQQLVDSDFETLRSMQQLANYVRFQGDVR